MRRRDGGAGRRRDRRTGPQSGGRAPGKSGPSVGAAPGWFGSQPAHGRRRGSARGRYPPARSWLTAVVWQLRVWRRFSPERQNRNRITKVLDPPKSAARRRKEERRSRAPRGAGSAYPALISGDPEMVPTARRDTGAAFRTSACRRSAPSFFSRERKKDKGQPGALPKPGDGAWLFDNRIGNTGRGWQFPAASPI